MTGHVSKRMPKHYSHIRTQAKRRAVYSMVAPMKVKVETEQPKKEGVSDGPTKESVKVGLLN